MNTTDELLATLQTVLGRARRKLDTNAVAYAAETLKRNGHPGIAGRLRGIMDDIASLERDIKDERGDRQC